MNVLQICLRRRRLFLGIRKIADRKTLTVAKCEEQRAEFALQFRARLLAQGTNS